MNLRGMANSAIQCVNPNILATLRVSSGYTVDDAGAVTPSYVDSDVYIQLQTAVSDDLKMVDNISMQGIYRTVIIDGEVYGLNRNTQQSEARFIIDGDTYKVVQPLRLWGNWCKLLVVLQNGD